jgi:hypothetical protein
MVRDMRAGTVSPADSDSAWPVLDTDNSDRRVQCSTAAMLNKDHHLWWGSAHLACDWRGLSDPCACLWLCAQIAVCIIELWPEARGCKDDRALVIGMAVGALVMGWTLAVEGA